ncbi:hypothetical protein [Zunongwangia sp. HRR-M8]|uniref:hypothetical protein n=1 Tax=Zunongwangia sp. HRR-M8 TaxID=3015170 RepID=UPI0022DD3146|nr:hypothetical protein [Zunongwangia sp. HRR-M8]WBL23466.1 hypothetical protein PBT89_05780 [Zunongwangia sp. HRR-M8]
MKFTLFSILLVSVFLVSCSGIPETRDLDTGNAEDVQVKKIDSSRFFYEGMHRIKRRQHSDKQT